MVEALACKAGLSGLESHRYLHSLSSYLRSNWVQFALKIRCRLEASVLLPNVKKRWRHYTRRLAVQGWFGFSMTWSVWIENSRKFVKV